MPPDGIAFIPDSITRRIGCRIVADGYQFSPPYLRMSCFRWLCHSCSSPPSSNFRGKSHKTSSRYFRIVLPDGGVLWKILLTAFILKQETGRRCPNPYLKKRLRRGVRIVGHGRKYFYEASLFTLAIFPFPQSFNGVSDEGNEKIVAIRSPFNLFGRETQRRKSA